MLLCSGVLQYHWSTHFHHKSMNKSFRVCFAQRKGVCADLYLQLCALFLFRSCRGHHKVFEAWFLLVQCAHWVQVAVQLLVTSGPEDSGPLLWLLTFYHHPTNRGHHRALQLVRTWNCGHQFIFCGSCDGGVVLFVGPPLLPKLKYLNLYFGSEDLFLWVFQIQNWLYPCQPQLCLVFSAN